MIDERALALEELPETEKQRQAVLKEIISTEVDYVRDLDLTVNLFLQPLRERQIITPAESNLLFANIEVLLMLNRVVLKGLQKRMAVGSQIIVIGDIFQKMAEYFKMYTVYCANHDKTVQIFNELTKRPIFANFLEECFLDPRSRNLTLFGFLIKPVQRICKYPLLIKELVKVTPEDHPDYKDLMHAQNQIEKVVSYINEGKRLTEVLQKVVSIQNNVDGIEIITPTRRFIREGNIYLRKRKGEWRAVERQLFLFNDMILLAKKKAIPFGGTYKYSAHFNLDETRLIDVANENFKFAFELIFGGKAYILCAANDEEKNSWFKDIKNLVRQYQKKKIQDETWQLQQQTIQIV